MKASFHLHEGKFRRTMALTMLVVFLQAMAVFGQVQPNATSPIGAPPSTPPASQEGTKKAEALLPGAMEVHFTDGSILKGTLKDEHIELETSYGKLLIPVGDIQRIEIGQRISEDVRKRIDAAIADLGHANPQQRQAAMAELVSLKEKAYPALLLAAKGKDSEAVHGAGQVLDKLRETVAESILERPMHNVVYTSNSKIAGRIKVDTFRVTTSVFGDQQAKLIDIRIMRFAEYCRTRPGPGSCPARSGHAGSLTARSARP